MMLEIWIALGAGILLVVAIAAQGLALFRPSGRWKPIAVGATIGAASTFGKAGKAYEAGIIFFIIPLGYNTGLLLFGFFSRRLREVGIWTIPDALQKRYGGKGLEPVPAA